MKKTNRILTILIFIFLYIPMAVLIVASFNTGKDITHFEGIRVYQRTLFMILHKAVHDLYPDNRFRIKHSLSKGFYCELEGITPSEEVAARVRERVDELIAQNIPIEELQQERYHFYDKCLD